ncbi:MAG: hypothetical protein IPG69_17405 [Flavobacteriales bacterium]|nr:hypothetical protein [Flavobacteriales bacterium]
MREIGLLTLVLACSAPAMGQSVADTIVIDGNKFLMHGTVLKPRQLLDVMSNDAAAYDHMRLAKRSNDYATAFGCVGGFLVGWPLGAAVAGGDPQWIMAGIGAGLIVVGITLNSSYKRHAATAVGTYNARLRDILHGESRLIIGPSSSGLGFALQF